VGVGPSHYFMINSAWPTAVSQRYQGDELVRHESLDCHCALTHEKAGAEEQDSGDRATKSMTREELLALPVVMRLAQAATAFGVGRDRRAS
jgi:hypothetical protein